VNTHKNICLITSGHSPLDERIFYKFGLTLLNAGYTVSVIASTKQLRDTIDGIKVYGFDGSALLKSEKLLRFKELLKIASPDLTICSEPLTIFAALRYKKQNPKLKIIYDITEWYPHQNMLNQFSGLKRAFYYLIYSAFNIYVSNRVDLLIIGEELKVKPYNHFAPLKKKKIISYYPSKKYFQFNPPPYNGKAFSICYTGIISQERGFPRFIKLIKMIAIEFPDQLFNVKIIGPFENEELRQLMNSLSTFSNIFIDYKDWVNYKDFSFELKSVDICIDLRNKNKVYNKSLPIKIFDYMACGKPVIYTKLDSLKRFPDINKFGLLIEPDDLYKAKEWINLYLNNTDKLKLHSEAARSLFEDYYNWELFETLLINVTNDFLEVS
jgi:glycosyltransferase involved in cell wall biosynthesis